MLGAAPFDFVLIIDRDHGFQKPQDYRKQIANFRQKLVNGSEVLIICNSVLSMMLQLMYSLLLQD